MHLRRVQFVLFAAIVSLVGCRPGQSNENAAPVSSPDYRPLQASARPTVAQVQWLGAKRISNEPGAAQLKAIWNLPESRKLEQQTLDKLSLAPWRWLRRSPDTNAALWLRPLLDDLLADESCLEIRQPANQPAEIVFAIQLDDQRAALWQTNLARVLESLTNIRPDPAPGGHYGWSLKKHHDPNFLELTRVGKWTVFGAAQDHNGLLGDLVDRLRQGHSPLLTGTANDWLEADLDPARLAAVFSLSAAGGEVPSLAGAGEGARRAVEGHGDEHKFVPNHLHLTVTGDGTNILTQATADFAGPLALDVKPWNLPSRLIGEPLSSFTLIRGFKPWLESSPAWNNAHFGPPPDQACCWALQGLAMQSYFAAPLPEASNEVDRLADWVLQNQGRWFPTNDLARFEKSQTFNGLQWGGVPYVWPFLRSITVSNQDFVFGGGIPDAGADPALLSSPPEVLSRTNLLYRNWEITGQRIEQWLYLGQFARFVSHKAQLMSGSPGVLWLKAVAPKLGASKTDITQTGPNQLSFNRKSTIGFTGLELNLLADWLESPQFPIGLYTFLAPPPQM
jgi:hypothetical protein